MNNKTLIYVILVILSLCILIGMIWCVQNYPKEVIKTDTIEKVEFKWKDTIIKDTVFIPKVINKLKVDTFYTKEGKDTLLVTESKEYKDTISTNDGDSVVLNQWITGIQASLDSTSVILKKKEVIKTIEITKTIEKKRKFNFGVGVGYGFGVNNRQFEPFIGVMASYNFGF